MTARLASIEDGPAGIAGHRQAGQDFQVCCCCDECLIEVARQSASARRRLGRIMLEATVRSLPGIDAAARRRLLAVIAAVWP